MDNWNHTKKNPKLSNFKPFEIHISKIDDYYHFIIEDPANPIASFSEKLPIPFVSRVRIIKKLKEFLAQVGILRGSLETPPDNITHDSIEKLGHLIFRYMVPATCKPRLCDIQTEHVILSTEDVELPWELMHDGEDFFCLKYSIGRRIQARIPVRKINRPQTDRINFLFISNPTLDLPKTEEEVSQIARFLKRKGNVKVTHLNGENASVEGLMDVLEEEYFDVIHYAGHAIFNAKNPEYSVIKLYNDNITAKYLLNIIDAPPRLVFMNACESASSADIYYLEHEGKLTGLATAFISAGVDAYIGALWPVVDEIAAELAINFYNQLLSGETVGKALRNAKLKIRQKYNDFFTWAAFILYGDPTSRIQPYLVDKVKAHESDIAKMLYNRGIDYYRLGKFNEAISCYDEALKIDPNYVDALIAKGIVLVALKRENEAIRYFNKALKLNPSDYSAKINAMEEMFNRAHFYHLYSNVQKKQAEFLIFLMKQYAAYFDIKPKLILDVGCGTGALTNYIWREHFPEAKIVGVDISKDMIRKAMQELPEGNNIEYICSDIKDFSYPNKFDIIYSNSTMHWIKDQERAYRNIHSLMANKSILVVHQGHKGCYKELREVAMKVLKKLRLFEKFEGFSYPLIYHTKDSIKYLLEKTGFKLVQAHIVETGVTETLVDDFVEAGLLPYRKLLTKEEDEVFVKEFKREARKLPYIDTTRLYFVAVKK